MSETLTESRLFNFTLPKEFIAQQPLSQRDLSNLAVADRKSGKINLAKFNQIDKFFKKGDILVINNTKVMPARIPAKRKTGGRVEILLLKKTGRNLWECLLRPLKRVKEGEFLEAGDTTLEIKRKNEKTAIVKIPPEVIKKFAQIPFPPYIKNKEINPHRYQTVYAKKETSLAAPTAGLHFTKTLLGKLRKKGVKILSLRLDVGWGTFKPIRTKFIEEHEMEEESFFIPSKTAEEINKAIESGRRIIACGTTVVRALEAAGSAGKLNCGNFSTNLFIKPGYKFKIVTGLITNFHTPLSTLLVLVCAFAGRDLIFKVYNEAIKRKWRFFSFGDAMLIL